MIELPSVGRRELVALARSDTLLNRSGLGVNTMGQGTMQKGNLVAAPADVHGRISKQTVALEGVSVTRVTFAPGARWSIDLKPAAGTELCELPHVAVVLGGALAVQMRDGSVQEFTTNDVMLLPPGHDAWTIGDEPFVFVEFSRGNDYYAEPAGT